MNSPYSREQAAVSLEPNFSVGEPLAMSKTMRTAKRSSRRELPMEFWMKHLSSETLSALSATASQRHIMGWLMSLPAASPASHSRSQERGSQKMTPETCGPKPSHVFASLNLDLPSSKTSPVFYKSHTSDEYLGKLPKAGMICDGECWELPTLEQIIAERDSGFWPTPRANKVGGYSSKDFSLTLEQAVLMWPTPNTQGYRSDGELAMLAKRAKDYEEYHAMTGRAAQSKRMKHWPTPVSRDWKMSGRKSEAKRQARRMAFCATVDTGGQLNPTWVEWLMGWPLGWTDLRPLEMDKYQQWLREFGS